MYQLFNHSFNYSIIFIVPICIVKFIITQMKSSSFSITSNLFLIFISLCFMITYHIFSHLNIFGIITAGSDIARSWMELSLPGIGSAAMVLLTCRQGNERAYKKEWQHDFVLKPWTLIKDVFSILLYAC